MAASVDLYGDISNASLITAVDTAYGYGGQALYASAVTMTFPELEEVERVFCHDRPRFPYIPGLVYFREGPVVLETLSELKEEPDVIVVHGHGIAHPQRCGIACYVGQVFDRATIGCSRRLLGGFHRPVPDAKGSSQPITMKERKVGVALRSKDRVKPLFVSPGHLCDASQSLELILRCLRGYRMPEPLRLAHLFANKYKRKVEKEAGKKKARPQAQIA